jgi:hypothetical protein
LRNPGSRRARIVFSKARGNLPRPPSQTHPLDGAAAQPTAVPCPDPAAARLLPPCYVGPGGPRQGTQAGASCGAARPRRRSNDALAAGRGDQRESVRTFSDDALALGVLDGAAPSLSVCRTSADGGPLATLRLSAPDVATARSAAPSVGPVAFNVEAGSAAAPAEAKSAAARATHTGPKGLVDRTENRPYRAATID